MNITYSQTKPDDMKNPAVRKHGKILNALRDFLESGERYAEIIFETENETKSFYSGAYNARRRNPDEFTAVKIIRHIYAKKIFLVNENVAGDK